MPVNLRMPVLPSPTQILEHPLLREKKIQLIVKRDDLIHQEIMGNKWRKLKYNLQEAKNLKRKKLITIGGAFSNHIYATAAAGKEFGFQTFGIIRGEELSPSSNQTLEFASRNGMHLQFVDREYYRKLRQNPEKLLLIHPDAYVLPEGGTNELAIKGCMELVEEIDFDFDCLVVPIGSGGTFCGALAGVNSNQTVIGVSSLKGSFIKEEISNMLGAYQIKQKNFQLVNDYHFGGYARTTPRLIDFINWFKEYFDIQLDPIYTGKSFFAVWEMIESGKFHENLRIVLLHTGGLQGISGFNRKKTNIIQ